MIARLKLYLALRKRKAIRLAQGKLVKAGISQARRRQWQRDPLRQ